MNNETQKQAASYGEPWMHAPTWDILQTSEGKCIIYDAHHMNEPYLSRAIQCVNACAGIEDPEKAIQAAREALASVLAWVWPDSEEDGQHSACYTPDSSIGEVHPVIDGDKFRAALAQLNNTK